MLTDRIARNTASNPTASVVFAPLARSGSNHSDAAPHHAASLAASLWLPCRCWPVRIQRTAYPSDLSPYAACRYSPESQIDSSGHLLLCALVCSTRSWSCPHAVPAYILLIVLPVAAKARARALRSLSDRWHRRRNARTAHSDDAFASIGQMHSAGIDELSRGLLPILVAFLYQAASTFRPAFVPVLSANAPDIAVPICKRWDSVSPASKASSQYCQRSSRCRGLIPRHHASTAA